MSERLPATGLSETPPSPADGGGDIEQWSTVFVLERELEPAQRHRVLSRLTKSAAFVQTAGTSWLVVGVNGAMDMALAEAVSAVRDALASECEVREVRMIAHRDAERRLVEKEPVRYYGVTECARSLGVTRQRVHQLLELERLPAPDAVVGGRPIWEASSFESWAKQRMLLVNETPVGRDPNQARPDSPDSEPPDKDDG